MRQLKYALVALAAALSVLPGATITSAATPYTCTGGVIPPGTYQSLTVAGSCSIPAGSVTVLGGVTILPGASLNAVSPAATVDISGGVRVESNAILVLGCSPSLPCPNVTNDRVNGGIRATDALAVILHGNTIEGHVSIQGGGGGVSCAPNPALSAVLGFGPIPAYSSLENNTVTGGVSVSGYQSCWLGLLRNNVRGTVTVVNNILADPDAVEVASNTVAGSLSCFGNSDVILGEGTRNTVTGSKRGQCAGL